MLDSDPTDTTSTPSDDASESPAPKARKRAPRKAAAKAGPPPVAEPAADAASGEPAAAAPAPRKRAPRKAAAKASAPVETEVAAPEAGDQVAAAPAAKAPAKRVRKIAAKTATPAAAQPAPAEPAAEAAAPAKKTARKRVSKKAAAEAPTPDSVESTATAPAGMAAPSVLFMAPDASEPTTPRRRRVAKKTAAPVEAEADSAEPEPGETDITTAEDAEDQTAEPEDVREAAIEQASGARRRRRRGRRGRGGGSARNGEDAEDDTDDETPDSDDAESVTESDEADETTEASDDSEETTAAGTRRRRRRRRSGAADSDDDSGDNPPNTVTHVRERNQNQRKDNSRDSGGESGDGVRGVKGSTRLEAKRQRRRDGRETTRRRAPILTEAEFLARREAVDRVMAVRQSGDRTQIAVLEDDVLVEHYVTRASATSYVGNVYLGRVQNVLPSMEAAFIDIGKGRNGVLYAGEVNWDAAGLEGKSRAIEQALKSGDSVLVQVTKDPIGHKGARLTSQVSLPGRFLVYVPGGGMTGISRRLPDTERHRLKAILKKIVPDEAGVIVRTAAEGASEEDLTRDVERLKSQWEAIQAKSTQTKSAPTLVHGEPDLAIRVVRDVFNEDFQSMVVQGDGAWDTISEYLGGVAPDLAERASRHTKDTDLFHDLRVDEQLMKALDRKVWLPSGGSLVIDRTEAMTVIDVNTGKFVGSGGNLEQTVTRNNLEAAEEIVRQLRLRDVGGIVVIDFIDMVLESNRDLVLRRLTECLGRDRTKHQVAEVTSLGLVQMTRKRVGEGLLEAFSEPCEHCRGRGVVIHTEPVDQPGVPGDDTEDRPKTRRKRGARSAATEPVEVPVEPPATPEQRQAANAAIAAIHRAAALEKEALAKEHAEDASAVDKLATGLVVAAMDAEAASARPAVDDSDDATQEKVDDEPTDPTAAAMESVAKTEAPAPAIDDTPAQSESEPPSPNGSAPGGRRRRRAASRPAGPPVSG
ncbi:MAG TPA: Rne/Rng family ribonuclease [Jatrophihabitans sp.]|jgi:ribonuclease E|uniref:Rne/Rng family ribonuclease n=1 Tax=Jatrophihabitans sp. TaxID=1932789 RepID=UPI002E0BF1C8|nr:Rne/Rng family ribonuclease [Jatrophihabitans sp.]